MLKPAQIEFIENKVRELVTLEAVKNHYNKTCEVDKYANEFAKKVLRKGKQDEPK